jgi:23S rRNA (uracil1939-C5)-methyltransferase
VNHHQAQRLYETAIREANITKEDKVLDLYCGVGTITLAMASAAGKVIGVEVVPQAVEDAKENALRNSITNAEFICGDAGEAALELERRGVKADVVVVDPPRKGLNADAIEALARFAPKRIVYVSCDPATLGRDLALLKEKGYRLLNATAADLFPRCAHVETIVLLSKLPDTTVDVEIDMEELEETAGQTKATYPVIKQYILDNYGFKVPSLYIAQVKRKHGLEVRVNYNKPWSANSRPAPNVPPEKEQAIVEALRYFKELP